MRANVDGLFDNVHILNVDEDDVFGPDSLYSDERKLDIQCVEDSDH